MSVKLYAMTCGYLTMPFEFLVQGEPGMVAAPIPSYLIEHPKGRVIFDTGLSTVFLGDDEDAKTRELGPLAGHTAVGFMPGDDVRRRLEAFDRDPDRIDFIISSHLHLDHVGGNALIPNARWIVQKREWEAGCSPECQASNHYMPWQFDLGHDRIEANGEHDVFGDGTVVCIPTYGHTPGHQSLRLRLDGGEVVLTADACYMRKSLEQMRLPPGFLDDPDAMLKTLRQFKSMDESGVRLIFGHDPDQWKHLNSGPAAEITIAALSSGGR